MRPRRIARRIVARARSWGTPHVHCPGCGADSPVPEVGEEQSCFTCRMDWLKIDIIGDDTADLAAVRAVAGARTWAATWNPLMVDVPDGSSKKTVTLDCAFVYFPDSKP